MLVCTDTHRYAGRGLHRALHVHMCPLAAADRCATRGIPGQPVHLCVCSRP